MLANACGQSADQRFSSQMRRTNHHPSATRIDFTRAENVVAMGVVGRHAVHGRHVVFAQALGQQHP